MREREKRERERNEGERETVGSMMIAHVMSLL